MESDIVVGNGCTIKPLGQATFPLAFGDHLQLDFTLVVASLEVPCIIGYDLLSAHGGLVDVPNSKLVLNGTAVQCHVETTAPSLFRITTTSCPRNEDLQAEVTFEHGADDTPLLEEHCPLTEVRDSIHCRAPCVTRVAECSNGFGLSLMIMESDCLRVHVFHVVFMCSCCGGAVGKSPVCAGSSWLQMHVITGWLPPGS
jgi:hypothetical protein